MTKQLTKAQKETTEAVALLLRSGLKVEAWLSVRSGNCVLEAYSRRPRIRDLGWALGYLMGKREFVLAHWGDRSIERFDTAEEAAQAWVSRVGTRKAKQAAKATAADSKLRIVPCKPFLPELQLMRG